MVSCRSIACAIATLVPTPSALVASSGRSNPFRAEASKSPAKPPIPPIISGRRAFSTQPFISSTARSPASIETPAAAYALSVTGFLRVRRSGAVEGVRGTATGQRDGEAVRVDGDRTELEEVLADEGGVGQLDRVDAVETGPAQVVHRDAGRLHQLLQGDVGEGVSVDRAADLVGGQPVRDQLGPGGE